MENSPVAIGLEKLDFIPTSKKGSAKEYSNYRTTVLISHASKVMLKILQARLQQYMIKNFQVFKQGLEKQRNQRSNCQHLLDQRKQENFRKTSTSASLTMRKALTVWIATNSGKFLKRWEYQSTLLAS